MRFSDWEVKRLAEIDRSIAHNADGGFEARTVCESILWRDVLFLREMVDRRQRQHEPKVDVSCPSSEWMIL